MTIRNSCPHSEPTEVDVARSLDDPDDLADEDAAEKTPIPIRFEVYVQSTLRELDASRYDLQKHTRGRGEIDLEPSARKLLAVHDELAAYGIARDDRMSFAIRDLDRSLAREDEQALEHAVERMVTISDPDLTGRGWRSGRSGGCFLRCSAKPAPRARTDARHAALRGRSGVR